MGGVLEAGDALTAVVVADPPDEDGDPAGGLVVERREHLGHVERGVADVDQAQDVHGFHPMT